MSNRVKSARKFEPTLEPEAARELNATLDANTNGEPANGEVVGYVLPYSEIARQTAEQNGEAAPETAPVISAEELLAALKPAPKAEPAPEVKPEPAPVSGLLRPGLNAVLLIPKLTTQGRLECWTITTPGQTTINRIYPAKVCKRENMFAGESEFETAEQFALHNAKALDVPAYLVKPDGTITRLG